LETQAPKAAQSAATLALSEGSTRLLHDIVLGIVTSPEVRRRRRRRRSDVTRGKLDRRRRRRRRSDVTRGKLNCAAAATRAPPPPLLLPPPPLRLWLSLLLL
jgi:hypothetical protein